MICWCACIDSNAVPCTNSLRLKSMCDKNTPNIYYAFEKCVDEFQFIFLLVNGSISKQRKYFEKVVNIVHFIKHPKKTKKMKFQVEWTASGVNEWSYSGSHLKVKFVEYFSQKILIKRKSLWPNKVNQLFEKGKNDQKCWLNIFK